MSQTDMARGKTKHDIEVDERAGYWELIRSNANFRRLWIGNATSLLGDWFNLIALATLVSTETQSPLALSAIFIAKMLPWAISAPVAGLIVDRFNRRRLMIGADLARAVIVLGFLAAAAWEAIALIYVLIALEMVVGSVYVPAKSAAVPNITTPRELLTANALSSATWSTMLAVGAGLGGFVTAWLGVEAVFIIDGVTYLIGAWFVWRTVIPQHTEEGDGALLQTALRQIAEGWTHLRRNARIGRIALAKATWAVAGGGLVFMLVLIGEEVSPGAIAAGMGVLFMARGIGTGIGPVVARAAFTDQSRWPTVLGASVAFSGLCYLAVSFAPWAGGMASVALLIVLIAAAHAASGANFVLATVLLQKRTEDRFRGRVFATEWLLIMLAETGSILTAGLLLEFDLVSLPLAVGGFALAQAACGLLWLLVIVPRERRSEAQRTTDASAEPTSQIAERPSSSAGHHS